MKTLKDKIAVIFAASGAISGAIAKAFAKEGAVVYLSARDYESVKSLANHITARGGNAHAECLDAQNELDIDNYLSAIVKTHGRIDIVFNGIGVRPSESDYGVPTTELSFEQFMKPIRMHLGSQFLTSRIAARYMMKTQTPGTILTLSASLSRLKIPFMAGITSACSAIEGLTRVMAAEFGQSGVKVICINSTSITETPTIRETTALNAKTMGISTEVFEQNLRQQFLLPKGLTLDDIGRTAAFLASDAGAVFNSHILDIDFGSRSVI